MRDGQVEGPHYLEVCSQGKHWIQARAPCSLFSCADPRSTRASNQAEVELCVKDDSTVALKAGSRRLKEAGSAVEPVGRGKAESGKRSGAGMREGRLGQLRFPTHQLPAEPRPWPAILSLTRLVKAQNISTCVYPPVHPLNVRSNHFQAWILITDWKSIPWVSLGTVQQQPLAGGLQPCILYSQGLDRAASPPTPLPWSPSSTFPLAEHQPILNGSSRIGG